MTLQVLKTLKTENFFSFLPAVIYGQLLSYKIALRMDKRKIFIHVYDLSGAKALSDFLYTASLASFLPHSVGHYEEMTPIHIDWDHKFVSDDFMINLKADISSSFSRYLRLIEIVSQNEEDKKISSQIQSQIDSRDFGFADGGLISMFREKR